MEYDHHHSHSLSFRSKLKASITCTSCFNSNSNYEDHVSKVLEPSSNTTKLPTKSTWFRSELPEIKDRCTTLFSGRTGRNRHRGNSAEFRYDPLSYALNFEDDDSRIDEYHLRNFSARLPPSTQQKKNVVVPREIAAWS